MWILQVLLNNSTLVGDNKETEEDVGAALGVIPRAEVPQHTGWEPRFDVQSFIADKARFAAFASYLANQEAVNILGRPTSDAGDGIGTIEDFNRLRKENPDWVPCLDGLVFRGIYLCGANLSGIDMRNADLTGANLSESHCSGADFTDAVLRDAVLDFANLREAVGLTAEQLFSAASINQVIPPANIVDELVRSGYEVNILGAILPRSVASTKE